MSRDITIVIHAAGGASPSEKGSSRFGAGTSDPGEDITQAPVSNPGEDLTQAPVSNPGEDITQAPVSNPEHIAASGTLVHSFGGCTIASSEATHERSAGHHCCCQACETADPRGGYGQQQGLDYSGFVIIRLIEGLFADGAPSLHHLACQRQLRGLLQALLVNQEEAPLDATTWQTEDGCLAYETLDSWPLILSCTGQPLARTDREPGPALPVDSPGEDYRPLPPPSCPRGLEELERVAAAAPSFRPLHSLRSYWRLDARPLGSGVVDLVQRLNALGPVDLAYRELAATDPATGSSLAEDQGYLDSAPTGIGARSLKDLLPQTSQDTARVHIVDLEQGWNLLHQSLFLTSYGNPAPAFGGDIKASDPHHGTAVLSQLIARNSSPMGVEGLLPDARVSIASHYFGPLGPPAAPSTNHPLGLTNGHVANGIVAALLGLSSQGPDVNGQITYDPMQLRGVCLLLEVQRGLRPTEVDPADCDAIRLATALGVTVIEAGGNGGFDLDSWTGPDGRRSLNRRSSDFLDSGAILVGAAWSSLPHDRARFSNFGSRMDCYAWGDNVTTAGFGNLAGDMHPTQEDYYTNTFGGTSAASPIIAGAAGLLQTLASRAGDPALRPARVRALLSDPATGTPQGPNVGGRIGIMPDLEAIARDTLGLAPSAYIRRSLCDRGPCRDDGSGAGTSSLTSSPDILFLSDTYLANLNTDPRAYFSYKGLQIGFEAIGYFGHPGDPHSIFVRAANRGSSPTSPLQVNVYSAPVATFLAPEAWTRIGTADLEALPPGDLLHVSTALPWVVNGSEPRALLAILEAAGSSPTILPQGAAHFDLKTYLTFLGQPTVACRNVHLVPEDWATNAPFAFEVTGAPDGPRRFDLEITARLPAHTKLTLEVPHPLAAKLRQRHPWLEVDLQSSGKTRLVLPRSGRFIFDAISLAAGSCAPAAFHLETSTGDLARGHGISVRQIHRGTEVGRIDWHIRRFDAQLKNKPF